MKDSERFQEALQFASSKHEGQYRIGGLPYITHPKKVAEMLAEQGYGMDYQITGLFHDLLEDTDATEQEIEGIGGKRVLEAVKLLTKRKGYIMEEYIAGIRNNSLAMAVKAADRLHNLRCAVAADEAFKQRYIRESIRYYLDFSPEIPQAIEELAATLKSPVSPDLIPAGSFSGPGKPPAYPTGW